MQTFFVGQAFQPAAAFQSASVYFSANASTGGHEHIKFRSP
jgi:hypothetical protein